MYFLDELRDDVRTQKWSRSHEVPKKQASCGCAEAGAGRAWVALVLLFLGPIWLGVDHRSDIVSLLYRFVLVTLVDVTSDKSLVSHA